MRFYTRSTYNLSLNHNQTSDQQTNEEKHRIEELLAKIVCIANPESPRGVSHMGNAQQKPLFYSNYNLFHNIL